uniref:Proteasome inhibitor PI31 subunit n=1 Tax=Cyprinus carpio carpio TaxID=630221 RepID=A0A9J8B550_CYPCA
MAGLELLFNCVANSITCSQDALICFVHWEIVKSGYKCLGIGDEPKDGEKSSELLPPGWSESKELYALRYRSNDDKSNLLLKAFTVDSTLIFNLMDSTTEKVTDLTVNVSEYVDEANLQTFESVFKNTDELITKLKSSLLPPKKEEGQGKTEKKPKSQRVSNLRDPHSDPLLIPSRGPPSRQPPNCSMRALTAALCLLFEALRVLCVWRCRLWTERLGERCPVSASLPTKTASLGDLGKSGWLKPTQTFIYLLERSHEISSLRSDSLTFISCLFCMSLSIKKNK